MSTFNRFELGVGLFLGWGGSTLSILGGGLLCCGCRRASTAKRGWVLATSMHVFGIRACVCACMCVHCGRISPCASCPPVVTTETSQRCTKPRLSRIRSPPEHTCDTEGAEPKGGQRLQRLLLLSFAIVYSVCSFCSIFWLIEILILCWFPLLCEYILCNVSGVRLQLEAFLKGVFHIFKAADMSKLWPYF